MAAQFDLYHMQNGSLVVILQHDLLDEIRTRVVAPLVPASAVNRVMHSLNPTVTVGEQSYIFMPQLMATLDLNDMGEKVGSLAMMRDVIVRALDALLSGI